MAFPGFYCASRLAALLMFGVVQIQEFVFPPKNMTLNDTMRYQNGEIWWFQVRDDSHILQEKMDHCTVISQHSASFKTKAMCMVQRSKFKAKFILTELTKTVLCFTADVLSNLSDSITTPLGLFVTIQLLVAVISLTVKAPFLKHNHFVNVVKTKMNRLVNFIPDLNHNNNRTPGRTGQAPKATDLSGSLVTIPGHDSSGSIGSGLDPKEITDVDGGGFDADDNDLTMMASQSLEGFKKRRVAFFRDDLVLPGNTCDEVLTMMRSKAAHQVTSADFKVRSYPDIKGH